MKDLRRNKFIDMLEMAELLFEEKDNFISCDIPRLGKLIYYPKSDKINVHVGNKWCDEGYARVRLVLMSDSKKRDLINNGYFTNISEKLASLVKMKEQKSDEELRNEFAGLAMQGLLSNPEWMKIYDGEKYLMEYDVVAKMAFDYADAMVKFSKL